MKKKLQTKQRQQILFGMFLILINCMSSVQAAEKLAFVSGGFKRSISISSLEELAKTGKATGFLADVLKFSNQDAENISNLLNEKHELPIVMTSRLINTTIGEVIISRVADIIHPLKVKNKSVSVPAIRAGIILGIQMGDGSLNALQFLKAYPNKIMAVNLPELFRVLNKVDSISDLVKFYSATPLEASKETKP